MITGRGTIFHPSFAYHPRATVDSAKQVRANVYAPTGANAEWVPGVGMDGGSLELVWSGWVRVQPDKDWRARARMQGSEFDAVIAVRVQLGIGKNEHGAVLDADGKVETYGVDPLFKKDFVIIVTESPITGTAAIVGVPMTVRNAITAGAKWQYSLLCDSGTK